MRLGLKSVSGAILASLFIAQGVGPMHAQAADPLRRDVHSFSNPDEILVRFAFFEFWVDFDRREIKATAELKFDRQPGSPHDAQLVLDAKGLNIAEVEVASNDGVFSKVGSFEQFNGKDDPILGRALTIPLPLKADRVRIRYVTSPEAGALQWLDPARTAGGKSPFLFTQSQAIQARTWLPLQDSPGVRISYAATVHVPRGMTAVMAADPMGKGLDPSSFSFEMKEPIPSYLIALAVGDLAFRPLGPRTGVWAEPSMLDRAAFEFADTEAMVEVTEKRFGPYRWVRYDLLVLPPSFPFGGMENPKLTFATPTILAGDRSLVSLVAHELAHSWSGNLVTNATWRDFWLNEGFTVYLERRIIEDLYGADRAGIEAVLGLQELREELTRLPLRDQVLHIDLTGRDPDDGMTQVPYEKGALFLTELEHAFGRDRFDSFLRDYFRQHSFQSIITADFLDQVKTRLFPLDPKAASKVDLEAWVEGPGLKVSFAEPTSKRLDLVDQAARSWVEEKTPARDIASKQWTTQEWLRFLRSVPESTKADRLKELDDAFVLTARENAEVAALWLLMAVRAGYHPADARLESFLTSIGRRKFLMPIYRELIKTPEGTTRAKLIYAKARPFYHPIAVDSVDRLLGIK